MSGPQILHAVVAIHDQRTKDERPTTDVRGTKRSGPATTPAMPAEMEYDNSTGSRW